MVMQNTVAETALYVVADLNHEIFNYLLKFYDLDIAAMRPQSGSLPATSLPSGDNLGLYSLSLTYVEIGSLFWFSVFTSDLRIFFIY